MRATKFHTHTKQQAKLQFSYRQVQGIFSLFSSVKIDSEAHPTSHLMQIVGSFPRSEAGELPAGPR